MLATERKILVTSALPYANGPLHIGNILEHIQTDIWTRFQRLRGHTCYFVCADDAHGTPIMLKADEQGISPQQLIDKIAVEHKQDLNDFLISTDNYHSTHSDENRVLSEMFYKRFDQGGHITRRTIKQLYDVEKQLFLPDRYVKGTCPHCQSENQYGDNCENCGATYSPTELIEPRSVLSNSKPEEHDSEQLFFSLGNFRDFLTEWLAQGHTQPEIANKQKELLANQSFEWDISRNAPYWGFEIPGEPEKYFYVWLEAPIGYLASFKNYCDKNDLDFEQFLKPDTTTELYHFIGKDIARFHTLFWPAQLHAAGFRTPTAVWCHGFLTVNGLKMSKSRGTFILARTYLDHLTPEYLRYYFAAKLDDSIDDIDLNLTDFQTRINADLIGKLVNIASRCQGFINKGFAGKLSDSLDDQALFDHFVNEAEQIAVNYETRRYSQLIRKIMMLADQANQYIDNAKPWILFKSKESRPNVQLIATQGLNLFRLLIIYLKPVLPQLAYHVEQFFNIEELSWNQLKTPLLNHTIKKYEPLMVRIEDTAIQALLESTKEPDSIENSQHDKNTMNQISVNEPISEQISFATFARVDLRIVRIINAEQVENADKLLKLTLDLGGETRQVFAGIKFAYNTDQLIGKLTVMVANLAPRKMRFGISEGMILAAGPGGENIFLLNPDHGANPGMKVN